MNWPNLTSHVAVRPFQDIMAIPYMYWTALLPDSGKFRKKSSNIAVEKNYFQQGIGAEL
jgi:hypothetical protein